MAFNVRTIRGDDATQYVTLVFYSHTGQFVAFLDADGADALAEQLTSQASTARAGIIVAASMPALPETPK